MPNLFHAASKACAALCLLVASSAAIASTPTEVKNGANANPFTSPTTYSLYSGYIIGVLNSIQTIQHLGVIGNQVCMPTSYTYSDLVSAINAGDTSNFVNNDEGGTMFVFVALRNRYPCR